HDPSGTSTATPGRSTTSTVAVADHGDQSGCAPFVRTCHSNPPAGRVTVAVDAVDPDTVVHDPPTGRHCNSNADCGLESTGLCAHENVTSASDATTAPFG